MWSKISSKEDWVKYCVQVARDLKISPDTIVWGDGPKEYPCLVSSILPARSPGANPRAYSAFVYRSDFQLLEEVKAAAAVKESSSNNPTQDNFNRWITAQMLTVIHYMTATGICKSQAFEDRLLEFIEVVDSHRNRQQGLDITSAQQSVLDCLDPPQ